MRQRTNRVLILLGIAALCLLGISFLPPEAKKIALFTMIPIAAAVLPSVFLSALNARCVACKKRLPIDFRGGPCPACGEPQETAK